MSQATADEDLYIVFGVKDISPVILPLKENTKPGGGKYYNAPLNSYASMWYNISIVKISKGLFSPETFSPNQLMEADVSFETACVNHNGMCLFERGKFYMGWCKCTKLYDNSILLVKTSIGKLISVDLQADGIKVTNRLQRNTRLNFDKHSSEILLSFRTEQQPKDLFIASDEIVSTASAIVASSVTASVETWADQVSFSSETDARLILAQDMVFHFEENEEYRKMEQGYYFHHAVDLELS